MRKKFKYVGIETTTICNTDCFCCPRKNAYELSWQTMHMDLFEKIIMDIYENHDVERSIRFGGMGDPSCDKHLIKRLKFVKKNAPELKISLSSNMEVWKPELTKIIVSEVLISSMRFSILAYTPKASNRIYGDNLLTEKARHQIDYFLSANAIAGHPIWTEVYTLLFQDQKGEVEKIKNRYWESVDEFEIWQPHGWSNRYPELRSKQKSRIKCKSVMEMDQPMIGIQGDFIPCSMDINYKLSLGNIGTNTVEQILDGKKYHELSELNQNGKLEDKPTCKGCVYLNADNSDVLYESKSVRKRIDR